MAESKTALSLATKLAIIGKEIGVVDKSGRNQQQNYNYIEYSVVAGRIRELFDKYRVIIIPSVENISKDEITNKYGGKGYHYVITMSFTLINGDDQEDREVTMWAGEASDYGDKGINKAETAGTKYFLMRLFNISEKDSEDADATTPTQVEKTRQTPLNGFTGQFSAIDIAEAKAKLGIAKDLDELKEIYSKLGKIMLNSEVIAFKNEMKNKLNGGI
jgi:hypothetical protein